MSFADRSLDRPLARTTKGGIRNPGCPNRIWLDFKEEERAIWAQLYRDFKMGLHYPEGIHPGLETIRYIACSHATQAIWSMRKLKETNS
jgi:hypothetical protein